MSSLELHSQIADGDSFYAALVVELERAGTDEALAFLMRLVLVLANQIGDDDVLRAALTFSRPKNTAPCLDEVSDL